MLNYFVGNYEDDCVLIWKEIMLKNPANYESSRIRINLVSFEDLIERKFKDQAGKILYKT